VGDAEVGKHVNIGAGVITANYDGIKKSKTTIGDNSFIGSDSQLIAPVNIAEGSYIAAGSSINKDTPAGKITIARARQKTIERLTPPTKNKKT
jgi:bifunctional UDP-N-acetylglucosamine pyrophosphorylase/glucosamine-1-phosphate N-acetyltransferase